MSALVHTRIALETFSMNQQPERRRSSRLAAYDQNDDDFQFMRVPKRKKVETVEEEPARESRKSLKPSAPKPRDDEPAPSKKPKRQMNFDSPTAKLDIPTATAKRSTRRSTRISSEKPTDEAKQQPSAKTPRKESRKGEAVAKPAAVPDERDMDESPEVKNGTKIALPLTDTPVINRNRDMRKKSMGTRRSSLGLRGRRASSLIDNGHTATPHREVGASEFYRHIGADGLPEPRRMKQLLVWCGERALGDKPAHNVKDVDEILAARAINQALLKDFANRPDMSDWFSREETEPPKAVVKKPNPLNIQNASKVKELEERIKRLKEERKQWKALVKEPPPTAPVLKSADQDLQPADIDTSLLDPEQAAILSGLGSLDELQNTVTSRLQSLQVGLEFKVDKFADGLHKLDQLRNTADRAATRVLAMSASRVEEHDKREKESIGTRDLPIQEVLRSLGQILNNTGASGLGGGSSAW